MFIVLYESIYPILEFDPNHRAKIQPVSILIREQAPKTCVITFFKEVIRKKLGIAILCRKGCGNVIPLHRAIP